MITGGAPGACTDCGNDAYIRLAGTDGETVMVCAHCFADHVPAGAVPEDTNHKTPERSEKDRRIHR